MPTSRFTIIILLLIFSSSFWFLQFSAYAAAGQPELPSPDHLSTQKNLSNQRVKRAALDRFTFAELHMGVRTRLTVYARDEAHARRACRLAFDRVAQLENSMSDYRLHSEINRLSQNAGGAPMRVSNDLFYVLAYAQELARLTDGAFDVTVSPLVRLWREARLEKKLPDIKKLAAARRLVGWKSLKLNRENQTAQLLKKGMQLDLGAIAKGYAGDCALNVLKAQGISSALFEAGGDVVLGEAPPGTKGWKIEIENATASGAPRVVELHNTALGASGDTNQFVIIGGKRYSHVVDPKTGLGLTNRVAVTVLAPRSILSDSLATAWSLADKKQRRRLKRAFPQAQVFLRYLRIKPNPLVRGLK